jgi:hypothetical protein
MAIRCEMGARRCVAGEQSWKVPLTRSVGMILARRFNAGIVVGPTEV